MKYCFSQTEPLLFLPVIIPGKFPVQLQLLSLLASGMTKRGDTKRAGEAKAFACVIDKMLAEQSCLLKFIEGIL